ncbi:hypothetical protein LDO51_02355 [Providencia alcalifaciens]|uniref:hypothetical protein n=1 Tax=Providencia alcalifaciens TaxID=126385 RepID=UPI001CE21A95|nr:hypothetical protein LDO51_02355 [Providencia alcalifaciens]
MFNKTMSDDVIDFNPVIATRILSSQIAIPLTISNNIANKTFQSELDRYKYKLNGKEFVLVSLKGDMLPDKTIGKASPWLEVKADYHGNTLLQHSTK